MEQAQGSPNPPRCRTSRIQDLFSLATPKERTRNSLCPATCDFNDPADSIIAGTSEGDPLKPGSTQLDDEDDHPMLQADGKVKHGVPMPPAVDTTTWAGSPKPSWVFENSVTWPTAKVRPRDSPLGDFCLPLNVVTERRVSQQFRRAEPWARRRATPLLEMIRQGQLHPCMSVQQPPTTNNPTASPWPREPRPSACHPT